MITDGKILIQIVILTKKICSQTINYQKNYNINYCSNKIKIIKRLYKISKNFI